MTAMIVHWAPRRFAVALLLLIAAPGAGEAQIERPTDAPPPLTAEESLSSMQLAAGFRLELIASEPLVVEPSGVCWDERGRLFVCELHGYNLEGQYDIEELNQSGQLDRIVRRVQAGEEAKQRALAGTYGTVKLLTDRDGDGRMDEAQVWADRLPPCYGICPARGGILVACAPDIYYLADRDGDGAAEIREPLLSGFGVGALERGVSAPQWGLDGWVYFGKGHGGGTIRGPRLAGPANLPNADFRMRSDGSAIEPVAGGTHTFGFAMTGDGERFVVSTATPGIFVAPIPWKYLSRNPDAAIASLEQNALGDQAVYPASRPHPWRTKRAEDPGFAKYYTDRYGVSESAPNGYFTSACSPLVYQDGAIGALRGQLLACEPAQNMVFRGVVRRAGTALSLARPAGEEAREFLAAADPWFHPIALAHAPDGSVYIVDFYREIIEDYSAIPRYLQQQYTLVNGQDRGRLYRLTHVDAAPSGPSDLTKLSPAELAAQVAGEGFWRRQTARRLLVERFGEGASSVDVAGRGAATAGAAAAGADIRRAMRAASDPAAVLNGLYALDSLGQLAPADVRSALGHGAPLVRVHGLRLSERWLREEASVREEVAELAAAAALGGEEGDAPAVILQAALTLGEMDDPRVLPTLAQLARRHAALRWMPDALLTSLAGRGGAMVAELVAEPSEIGQASALVGPLCRAVAARREAEEIAQTLTAAAAIGAADLQADCVAGLAAGSRPGALDLPPAGRSALASLVRSPQPATRRAASKLIQAWRLESDADRSARILAARAALGDLQSAPEARLAAANGLADEDDAQATAALAESFASASPKIQAAILAGLFARRDRLGAVLDAIESQQMPAAALSAVQRSALLSHGSGSERERAARLLTAGGGLSAELQDRYLAALRQPRDLSHGQSVYRQHCATCHAVHGEGQAVGPDLSAEFQRAEEAIVRDLLAPSETITAGYAAYAATTSDGRVYNGLLALESANSLTLRMAGGKEETVLRKDLETLAGLSVSLMPDDLARLLDPKDVADVIAWLRAPRSRAVLLDEDDRLAAQLDQGQGTAEFVAEAAYAGAIGLRVTPPQRFSPRIPGWSFRIREQPAAGEYRYLRFAWRVVDARGAMIELANDGRWPSPTSAPFRYVAGVNGTPWQALRVADDAPREWTVITRDLWSDCGDCTITGLAPTAIGGAALFDRMELLRTLDADERPSR